MADREILEACRAQLNKDGKTIRGNRYMSGGPGDDHSNLHPLVFKALEAVLVRSLYNGQ